MKHTQSSVRFAIFALAILLATPILRAQQQASIVPTLVNFSSVLTEANGKPLTGTVGATFFLYKDQQGGAPLWLETQNVQPDKTGHYSVMLGSAGGHGLPPELFASGEARWLGVQAQGQAEQPRVMLLAVPYALKAGDAQTVGGLPPSAFVLATPVGPTGTAAANSESTSSSNPVPPAGNVTGSGTVNFLPIWTGTSTIGNSVLFQAGTGTKAKLGIGTTKPASTLDVKGGGTIRGLFSLPATGTATASAGFNSQPMDLAASVFNSGTGTPAAQTFQWQAEPVGNNTSNAAGSLNLLFGQGTNKPKETGLNVASNGQITFAKGQTFPGTGNGTITGVTAGTDLTGGGNSGNVTLNVDTTKVVTGVTAGTDLTGGGTGGTPILNLDTTKVPQLSGNNSFTGNQSVSGSLTATSFSGNGASVTNVNAVQLGGLAPAAFAQLAAYDQFTVGLSVTTSSNNDGLDSFASAPNYSGVGGFSLATSGSGVGVLGATASASGIGVVGDGGTGVQGNATLCCNGPGGNFVGFQAAPGSSEFGTDGVDATGGSGDPNASSNGGVGVHATGGNGAGFGTDGPGGYFQGGSGANFGGGDGIDAYHGSGFAGYFSGDLQVTGSIFAGTKDFKIDHPLDPANKYLVHASVESSEMMNIYTGNVTTDAQGEATVQLPEWMEALNTNFRYQLTVIGQFAQAIIGRKIENNQFQIRTNAPNVEVSWQVTGVRQDAFAKAHTLVVEEKKEGRLQGFYIHPELYGAPEEKQIEWARHPEMMKQMKERREAHPSSPQGPRTPVLPVRATRLVGSIK
jgi:hypothetical protein